MKVNKIKKSPSQRLTFSYSEKSSPNNSFLMNGLKKLSNSKQEYYNKNNKNQSQSILSGLKNNSKQKKYLVNENIKTKNERKSLGNQSISFLKNQTSKISYSKIEENRNQKYILNSPKNGSLKTQSLKKGKNQPESSRIKSIHKKQSKVKLQKNQINNVQNRFSVKQNGKLKKKKINQTKNLNKTFLQERISTTLFQNNIIQGIETRFSFKPCYNEIKQNSVLQKSSLKYQNQFDENNKIQLISTLNSKNLQIVRSNSVSLYNSLPPKQRQNFTHITKGYEKILSQLSFMLSKKSKIYPNLSQTDPYLKKLSQKQISQSNLKNISLMESLSNTNSTTPQNSPKKFKKLQNLQKLRHSFSIKSYHEEFMTNKQEFSDSWKRQLKNQKQF